MRRAPSSGESDAAARFHHGTWYCGYVATRGRSAAPAKMKRIALVTSSAKVSEISVSGRPYYRAFFEELSRLGYVEGQNLGVDATLEKGAPNAMPNWSAMSSTRIPT